MFHKITEFEQKIAEFYGASYAVATDCCTHAIELCLRISNVDQVEIPTHTYLSVPMTCAKIGLDWNWKEEAWQDYYYIGNTNIVDAAVFWKPNGYIPNTMMCLSFQLKKHLSIGRGGMILLDNKEQADLLRCMKYDGRLPDCSWKQQDIKIFGYHYYLTPEAAMIGLEKFPVAATTPARQWSFKDYPRLPDLTVFKNEKNLHLR